MSNIFPVHFTLKLKSRVQGKLIIITPDEIFQRFMIFFLFYLLMHCLNRFTLLLYFLMFYMLKSNILFMIQDVYHDFLSSIHVTISRAHITRVEREIILRSPNSCTRITSITYLFSSFFIVVRTHIRIMRFCITSILLQNKRLIDLRIIILFIL